MWKLRLGIPAALSLALGLVACGRLPAEDEINWLGNYREAVRQAKATHKPIFLEFRCEA